MAPPLSPLASKTAERTLRPMQTVESTLCREVTLTPESHKKSQTCGTKIQKPTSFWRARQKEEVASVWPPTGQQRKRPWSPSSTYSTTTLHHGSYDVCGFIPVMPLPAVLLLKTWMISVTANTRWRPGFCTFFWPHLILDELLQPVYSYCHPRAPVHINIFHSVLLMLFVSLFDIITDAYSVLSGYLMLTSLSLGFQCGIMRTPHDVLIWIMSKLKLLQLRKKY